MRLRALTSTVNPEYMNQVKRGRPAHWLEPRLQWSRLESGHWTFPRGCIGMLRRETGALGVTIDIASAMAHPLDVRLRAEVPLRPYQRRAMEALIVRGQGYVVCPCGGGKTRIGIAAIGALGTSALVLVHTLDLARQWQEQVKMLLGIEPGMVGNGIVDVREVTIATMQTLNSEHRRGLLHALRDRFGCVIVDECQHTPCDTMALILDRLAARYRFGLTATPDREDGLGDVLDMYFGPAAATITHAELMEAGVLAMPKIRTVSTSFTFPFKSPDDMPRMVRAMTEDVERNAQIIAEVSRAVHDGHTCLVLSARVEHCKLLAEELHGEVLVGSVSAKQRAKILDDARAGNVRVICATSLADEGLDIPRLSRVFLATGGRAHGRTIQRIGRLMRTCEGKQDPVLVDFVDSRVGVLVSQYRSRRAAYQEILGVRE